MDREKVVTMKLPLSPFLTVIGALVALQNVNGSILSRSMLVPRRWTLDMRKHYSAFGLAAHNNMARGGAVEHATVEESKDQGEPVELYLPGLLETTISQTVQVSFLFF